MAMNSYLSENRFDLLREIGNIGIGNAVSSLSQLLNDERVNIRMPEVTVVSLGELPDHMDGPEKVVTGLYVEVGGSIDLHIIFILPLDSARSITSSISGGLVQELDEMGLSAVMEVGNIVTAGYINAFAELTEFTLIPKPPAIAVDLTEAILGSILAEVQVAEDFVILIKTGFETGDSKIEGFLCMIPAQDSFEIVYKKLLEGAWDESGSG
jgi:chemotaxis protein CheC